MSEHDANRAMLDTARLRILPDPLEQTQVMPVYDRRRRQAEARELRQVWLNVDWVNAAVQRELADLLGIQVATGAQLDALAGIKRPAGMTDASVRNLNMARRMSRNTWGFLDQGQGLEWLGNVAQLACNRAVRPVAVVDVPMNRGTGIASLNRYFAWGSELRPWPG